MARVSRWATQALVWAAGVLIGILLLFAAVSPWYLLGLNIDDSLPGRVYVVIRHELPSRDDIAAFQAPSNPYYPENAPFVKVVRGVPGDTVTRDGRVFFVNGRPIGVAKRQTRSGQPLTPGPTGLLPPHHYFFWTPHKDSYDSRYGEIGWINSERILGRAVRVWR